MDCGDCSLLNRHAHPEPTDNCHDCCCMCCGYCLPAGLAVFVVALMVAVVVFYALVMKDFPDAWRIVVCMIFIVLTIAAGCAVLWSYYKVIFMRPGYVQRDPWRYRPVFVDPDTNFEGSGNGNGNDNGSHRADGNTERCRNRLQPSQRQAATQSVSLPLPERDDGGDGVDGSPLPDTEGGAGVPYSPSAGDVEVDVLVGGERRPQEAESGVRPHDSPNHTPSPGEAVDGQTSRNPYVVTQLDRWGKLRYCRVCGLYKPDGAYHCHTCKRCVYLFDHHCPWVNNCVGRNNYRLFVIFLLYGAVGCLLACVLMTLTLFLIDKRDFMSKVGWASIPATLVVLALALGIFFVEHRCCLLAKGETTVETVVRQRKREERMRERGANPWPLKHRGHSTRQNAGARSSEEASRRDAQKKERAEAHMRALWGTETGLRSYLPYAIRTDDTAEGVRRVP